MREIERQREKLHAKNKAARLEGKEVAETDVIQALPLKDKVKLFLLNKKIVSKIMENPPPTSLGKDRDIWLLYDGNRMGCWWYY